MRKIVFAPRRIAGRSSKSWLERCAASAEPFPATRWPLWTRWWPVDRRGNRVRGCVRPDSGPWLGRAQLLGMLQPSTSNSKWLKLTMQNEWCNLMLLGLLASFCWMSWQLIGLVCFLSLLNFWIRQSIWMVKCLSGEHNFQTRATARRTGRAIVLIRRCTTRSTVSATRQQR